MKNSWPKFESLQKNIGDERIFLKDLRGLGRAVKKMSTNSIRVFGNFFASNPDPISVRETRFPQIANARMY